MQSPRRRIPDPTQSTSPTARCRCGPIGYAVDWLRRRLVTSSTSSRARTMPRPTVEAGRPCTETDLARGERFMVLGPMRLEDLKQTDGHRISALRRPSCGMGPTGLLLEGVLHLLASIFQPGLRLVQLPLVLGAVVTGELAGGFFCLAAHVVDLFA